MAFDGSKAHQGGIQRRSSSPMSFFSPSTTTRILDRDLEDAPVRTLGSNTLTYPSANDQTGTPLFSLGTPLTLSTSLATVPVPLASSTPALSSGISSPYVPPMNQISMPYIKRHAVKRVKSAKDACNTELQKVIHSITNYFEERLGEKEREEAEEQYAKAQMQQQYMREQHIHSRDAMSEDGSQASSHLQVGSSGIVPAAELAAAIQQIHGLKYDPHSEGMTDADDRPLTRANSRRTADSSSRPHSRQRTSIDFCVHICALNG